MFCSAIAASQGADVHRLADGASGGDWAAYGATYGEQHLSTLKQINAGNIARLGLEWSIDLPRGNSVSQPLAVDGVVYFVTGYGVVHAADAKSGRVLWDYDPKTYEVAGAKLRPAWGSRGIAWWKGKIYVGTQDGRLIAIDARTGTPVWSVMTVAPDDLNYITGAPRVFDGKVIIGFGGADVWPARGYVTTYDAETGNLLWRWYTVPGNPVNGFENKAMEMAAKTWAGEWWKYGGGGTAWNAFSYDPDTHTIFVGVGNGSPWNHKARSAGKGDNLFLCSVVALDANTGTYKWHYQFNPGESWDYTATMDMAFATLAINGKKHKVLMTAPKNGFFYVIDRVTGKLLSAEKIAKVTWASKIDLETGRPVEVPGARYPDGTTFVMWPSGFGAHSWYPMAFSPTTNLAYVPITERGQAWTDWELENDRWRQDSPISTAQGAVSRRFTGDGDPLYGTSRLDAWDPVTQHRVWSQPTPGIQSGGVMVTGGDVVFQGRLDGQFNAYAAATGKLLWSFQTNAAVLAPPISYAVDGRQYVTVLTGISGSVALMGKEMAPFPVDYSHQARRVLTFSLDAHATLPAPVQVISTPAQYADFQVDDAAVKRGTRTFGMRCTPCHGVQAVGGGAAPDLRASSVPVSTAALDSVVRGGTLLPAGMPRYAELTDGDLADIRQYIQSRAQAWRDELHLDQPAKAVSTETK
jgi:quinohemoprotein ethanol dehydrogenase